MPVSNDELIRSHYRQVAQRHGASPRSSMEDDYVRDQELESISGYRGRLRGRSQRPLEILDLGCGNGYALARLSASVPPDRLWGIDFSDELLEIARSRQLPGCTFIQGDARGLPFEAGTFDFIYTERCLINILDPAEQILALREIARMLKPGGDYLMIECFTDGLANNNKARADCGLPPIQEAYHNRYFEKDCFFAAIGGMFTVVDEAQFSAEVPLRWNFLSSYYFISRVVYPAMLHGGEVVRNSEMARFFSFLPQIGNYSPIQAFVLRKI
jgi:ubiquinone/menaquinone biosynthesis C-methylase UbiE